MNCLMMVSAVCGSGLILSLTGLVSPSVFARGRTLLAVVWLLAGCAWLSQHGVHPGAHPDSVLLLNWLPLPGSDGAAIGFQFTCDAFRASLVICAALLWLIDIRPTDRSARVDALPLLTGTALLLSDLALLALVWLLLDRSLLASREPGGTGGSRDVIRGPRQPVLPRVSGLLLIAGLLLIFSRYQTTNLTLFISQALQDQRPDTPVVCAGILACLTAACAVRCGQFPFLSGIRSNIETASATEGTTVLCGALLPGLALLLSLQPLSTLIADNTLLTATGLLTLLATSALACATCALPSVCLLLVSGSCGLIFMAAGSGVPTGISAASGLLTGTWPALLFLMKPEPRSQLPGALRWFAAVVIIVGLTGTGPVLQTLSVTSRPVEHAAQTADRETLLALELLATAGVGLAAFALTRCLLQPDRSDRTTIALTQAESPAVAGSRSVRLIERIPSAALLIGVPASVWFAGPGAMVPGPGTLAGLTGAITAWLMTLSRPRREAAQCRSPVEPQLEPQPPKLLINIVYLEDVQRALRLWSQGILWLADAVDRRIIGGTQEGAWSGALTRIADEVEAVHAERTWTAPVCGLLMLVSLIAALLWTGSL